MSHAESGREAAGPTLVTRYRIPAGTAQSELVIRHSTFVATVGHAPDAETAHWFIAQVRADHPGASHHAWAFKITGGPQALIGSSDDGEPGGTAGRPMLAVLEGSALREVVAVVSRYFGGVKLGTGGLVRAYGSVARQALAGVATAECVLHRMVRVTVGYGLYGGLQHVLARCGVIVEEATFAEEVAMLLAVPCESARQMTGLFRDLSRGQIALDRNWLEDRYYVTRG